MALKVARAVSQSRRAVSAKYFLKERIYCPRHQEYCGHLHAVFLYRGIIGHMNKTTKIASLCIAALALLFVSTRPNQLPSLVLIVPFLLLFLLFFVLTKWALGKLGTHNQSRTSLALLIAALPTLLLALQSLGQLTVRDIVMLLALFIITYFYMFRRTRSSNSQ